MLKLIALLKEIGIEDKNISEKIQNILERSRLNPQNSDLNKIKEIKSLNHNIWTLVHIFSELEIHKTPKFFETILDISTILCQVSAPLYVPFKRFYNELRTDYLLLDDGLLNIQKIYDNAKLSPNRVKIGVKITR